MQSALNSKGNPMKKIKTVHANSGHSIAIFDLDCPSADHPASPELYSHFYVAKNFDEAGVTFFYLARGYKDAPREIHVWYRNKKMWASYGKNFEEAINGAQRDGWRHAN